MVPEDIKSKVALEAISCATQLDGLVRSKLKALHVIFTCLVQILRGLRSCMCGEKQEL